MRNAKTMVKRIRAGRAVIVPNDKVKKVINLFEEREAIRVEGSSLPDHSYILLKEAVRDEVTKAPETSEYRSL